MKLERIELVNFRCFESVTVELDEHLTVLVAENGNGKTTIADGLAIALDRIIDYFKGRSKSKVGRWHIGPGDLRLDTNGAQAEFATARVVSYPVTSQQDYRFAWTEALKREGPGRFKSAPDTTQEDRDIRDYLKKVWQKEVLDDMPLCAYYRAGRDIPRFESVTTDFGYEYSLQDAFVGALDACADFRSFAEWFLTYEANELRLARDAGDTSFRIPCLQAVRKAISSMIPQALSIHGSPSAEMMVEWQDEVGKKPLSVHQLSDGQRAVLALAADLAHRLALANPDKEDVLASECIVIIDEVDLHLHPRWQQTVLADLIRTFPGAQFIVTTHSPQVVSTIARNRIWILNNGVISPPPTQTRGAESQRMLEEVFAVNARAQWLPEVQDLNKFLSLIEQPNPDPDEIKALTAKIQEEFGQGDPILDLINMSLEQKRLLGETKLDIPDLEPPADAEEGEDSEDSGEGSRD